ncbi:MAG: hypothetical protein K0S01_3089 [Herbinix sp.]|jgi:hypothetical protein|nr:hypothetical protein [Herbinix sp.]
MKKELKTVTIIGAIFVGVVIGGITCSILKNKEIRKETNRVNKFKDYYNILNQWFVLKNSGKSLDQYFVKNGYKTIAIYGMGEMGNRFYEEFKNSGNVKIRYAIDKSAGSVYSELEIVDVDDELESVDAIIVTATFAFDEIKENLSSKVNCAIISLEDVVYEA